MPPRMRSCPFSLCAVAVAVAVCLTPSRADDRQTDIAKTAREILNRRCFACHGANGVARKNVFVLDRDQLIASNVVTPGDPGSLLFKLIESGAMPIGDPKLTVEEIAVVRNWITSGAPNWDDRQPASRRPFATEHEILALIREDLLDARDRDRPFLRYFTLTHLYNSGVSDEDLETYQAGLSKLINSLSWHREIT